MWKDNAKEIGSLGPDACSIHGPQTGEAQKGLWELLKSKLCPELNYGLIMVFGSQHILTLSFNFLLGCFS